MAVLAAAMMMPAAVGSADPKGDADYRALVGKVRADMFRAGDRVTGWKKGGADPDSELRAAGSDRFYFQIEQADGARQVVLLTERPIAAIAPDHWRAIASYGSPTAKVENAIVQFVLLSPHHVLAVRAGSWRLKDVDCTKGIAHAVLFVRPGAPAQPAEGPLNELMARVLFDAVEGQTVCSRYDGSRETGWGIRHFLSDGRLVIEQNSERLRIVPAAPLETLLSEGE